MFHWQVKDNYSMHGTKSTYFTIQLATFQGIYFAVIVRLIYITRSASQ